MSTQVTFVLLWIINHCNGYIPTYNKFCVSQSLIPSDVEGTYEYSYFNSNTNATVYYNNEIEQYLYPYMESNDAKMYIIGNDPTTAQAHAYCLVSQFNPFYCTNNWFSWNKTVQNWTDDTNMRLTNCNDICITSGKPHTHLHATYIWDHFDVISNISVYNNTNYAHTYLHTIDGNYFIYNSNTSSSYNISDTFHVETCAASCFNGIQTPYYGEIIPQKDEKLFNEGKINEIVSWAVYNDSSYVIYQTIGYLQYKTDEIVSDIIGPGGGSNAPYFEPCPPFVLDTNDYINGYRVIYDEYVHGLTFYTFNGKIHNCNASDLNYSNYHDSGVIYDDNYYLSGFNIYVEWIIDAISFQFKSIHNCTHAPTIEPTFIPTSNPSVFPTTQPTNVPTVSPTPNPTYFPTINPTYFPTINPTHFPTINPTYFPTIRPTPTPTSQPTLRSTLSPTFKLILKATTPPSHSPSFHVQIILVDEAVIYSTNPVDNDIVYESSNTNRELILLIISSCGVIVIMISIGIFIGKCCTKKEENQNQVATEGENEKVKDRNRRMTTDDDMVSGDGIIPTANTSEGDIELAAVPTTKLSQVKYTTSGSFYSSDSSALYEVHEAVDDTTMGYQGE